MTTKIIDVTNIVYPIQMLLTADGHYKGELTGKADSATLAGIRSLLASYKIDTKGWTNERLLIAAEQAVYRSMKIPGSDGLRVDGQVGSQTRYSREAYQARLITNWRDQLDKIEEARPAAPKPEPVKVSTDKGQIIVPASAWPYSRDVVTFYGKPGSNQTTLKLPYPMVLAWEPKTKVTSWKCHRKVVVPFERIFQRTLDHYGYEKIRELRLDYWGGTLNVRKKRGGSTWSDHAFGCAVDIDPDRNALRTSWKNAQMSKPAYRKFVEFWYDEGMTNLGKERDFDAMHFAAIRYK